MVEKNIVDAVVIPETPKVQEGAVEMVYVPVATNNSKGIASYDEEAFKVIDGKVYINSAFVEKLVDVAIQEDFANFVKKDDFGKVQICCACQTMIDKSTGEIIETGSNRVKAGAPVVKQYALYSNGIALVKSVEESGDFTAQVIAYNKLTVNGKSSTTTSIYAPTDSGEVGQVLFSNGSKKAPTWGNVPTGGGGSTPANIGEIQFCCLVNLVVQPTSYMEGKTKTESLTNVVGTPIVGQYIKYNNCIGEITNVTSTQVEFVVKSVWGLGLNAKFTGPSDIFYAPTKPGEAGQVLVSQGSGKEPTWGDAPTGDGGTSSGSTKGYVWSTTWDSSAILAQVMTVDRTFIVPVNDNGGIDTTVSANTVSKKDWYNDKYDDKGYLVGEEWDGGTNDIYLYDYKIKKYSGTSSTNVYRTTFLMTRDADYPYDAYMAYGTYNMRAVEWNAYVSVGPTKYLVKEK